MGLRKHDLCHTARARCLPWMVLLCGAFLAGPADCRERKHEAKVVHSVAADSGGVASGELVIRAGTILPVRLNATLSSGKAKAGQAITGRIMQDVPLTGGAKIPAGSKVVGHIVEKVA